MGRDLTKPIPLLHSVVDMAQTFPRPLGDLEQCIMEAVWRVQAASGRDVFSVCAKQRRVAYTTIMTVMNRLVEKDLLERKGSGKHYTYRARLSQEAYEKQTSGRIIQGLIRNFGNLAIAQFVDTLDETDPKKLHYLKEKLRALRS